MDIIILILLILLVVFPTMGFLYEQVVSALDRRRYPAPGRHVQVNDHQLHMILEGADQPGPAVVMEGDFGGSGALDWLLVQPEVAKFAQVLTYDRAGYGWSEPGPLPRSTDRIIRDLHTLLEKSPVEPPYILVGHGYGARTIRVFADRYPELVAGIVLVDQSHRELLSEAEEEQEVARLRRIIWFKRFGLVRIITGRLLRRLSSLPAADRRRYMAMILRNNETVAAEAEAIFSEDDDLPESVGDVPLVVLSRSPVDESEESLDRLELQKELLELSANSSHMISEKGSHHIQMEEPQQVIDAIQQVVEQVRGELNNG